LSGGARLEHLAAANKDSGRGGRLVHDGAFLCGAILHYIKLRLSAGRAGHDWRGCSRRGNFFTTFQFPGAELKRVDMNAGGTASSELVYFELTAPPDALCSW
jgi:hypothetical protein